MILLTDSHVPCALTCVPAHLPGNLRRDVPVRARRGKAAPPLGVENVVPPVGGAWLNFSPGGSFGMSVLFIIFRKSCFDDTSDELSLCLSFLLIFQIV